MIRTVAVLLVLVAFLGSRVRAGELDCLSETEQAAAALYGRLQQEAYAALDRGTETSEQLKTPEDVRTYQKRLRDFFVQQLGGFPERPPLNAKTLRTIPGNGYRIECVIFDSQPQHRITANLYLPEADGPVPGVIVSSGHSRTGKTAEYNQRFGIAMARHGMAALCFDPIGQGERSQMLKDDGQPAFNGTTDEHFLIGVGSTLVGRNTATYRVWDAMRAIDYLVSRPEIDPQKIGMTGCSGGGTLTSYTMALEDRVAVAAPACYLTTFRRLIETRGPQDAEQNIFGQVAFGLDQPDYVLLRAPKPTIISATTGDFFSIDGAWDNFRQAKRVYGCLGFPEHVDLVEVEGEHGVQPQNLAAITQWMRRWLLGRDEPVPVQEYPTLEPTDLWCLDSGQVLTLPDEKSVFDLNTGYERELAKQRTTAWQQATSEERDATVRSLLKVRPASDIKPPTFKDISRVKRENYHIDKLVLRTDTGATLPGLTFHPPTPVDDAYLYLTDDGKLGDSQTDGPIEDLISEGYAVVTVDLSGQGETSTGKRDALLTDWKTYNLAYLLGKPLLGIRVEDALAAADFVAFYQKPRTKPRKVHLVGVGQAGLIALHAAALNPGLFETVTIRNAPRDWASVVRQTPPAGQLDSAVHGVLTTYDLPDLVEMAGKGKVRFEE